MRLRSSSISNNLLKGIVLLLILSSLALSKKYDAPYPDITSSKDSTIIARGEYLVYGPAHCASCHVPMDRFAEVEAGAKLPLTGGWEIDMVPGVFRATNITPDMETGIGKLSDPQIARALRYSVSHKDEFIMPFMAFQEMSDDDLTAIISFLRSQEAIRNEVEPSKLSFIGKTGLALGMVKPEGPIKPPPRSVLRDTSIEYGAYFARSVAGCYNCHTERDMKSGEFVGAPFAGGMRFAGDGLSQGYSFISPNITPDREGGIMATWDETAFITRMQAGRMHTGSPMPWGAYSQTDEADLKALYRYLMTIEPENRKIEKIVYPPGEKLP